MEVRQFRPMLASPVKDPTALVFPLLGSPKYDGVRAFVRGGILLSKQMKPIKNSTLQVILGQKAFEGLDGELVCGDPSAPDCFKRSQQMCSTRDAPIDDAIYFVFDSMEHPDEPFHKRLDDALGRLGSHQIMVGSLGISLVKQKRVNNYGELVHLEEQVLKLKFEGLMIRSIKGPYKLGRSTELEGHLLKLKRFEVDEAEVFGAYEQLANTNEPTINELGATHRSSHKAGKVGKGTLGGFHVKMLTGDFKGVACDVGTGWSDDERSALWMDWHKLTLPAFNKKYGHLRVKWQKAGSKDRPRFPTNDGWRDPDDMSHES